MIRFEGHLSQESRKYVIKKAIPFIIFKNIAIMLGFFGVLSLLALFWGKWVFILIAMVVIFAIVLLFTANEIKTAKYKFPIYLQISKDKILIESEGDFKDNFQHKSITQRRGDVRFRQARVLSLNLAPTVSNTKNYEKFSDGRNFSNIKKIIDRGKFYHFIFYLGYKSVFFVCQKDLLSLGSLSDFENTFKDKIVNR